MPSIKMSELRAKFPDYHDLSDDQLLMALHKTQFPNVPAGTFFNEVDRDTERAAMDPLKDTSYGERIAMDVGAGADKLLQGGKQLLSKVGIGTAPSDADIVEKRRLDTTLAQKDPWTGGAAQVAGEVLPTLAVPGSVLAAGAARVPILARTLAAAPGLAKTAAASSFAGAATAALSPVTSDESRPMDMLGAGMIGAVLPPGLSVAAAPLRGLGNAVENRFLGRSMAAKKAAEWVREKLPPGYDPQLAGISDTADITMRNPSGYGGKTFNLPQSAAQATNDPYLAQIEAYSRGKPATGPGWDLFDRQRNEQLFGATQATPGMAPTDLRMNRLEAVRAGRTAPMREDALQSAAGGNFADPVLAHADSLIQGPSGANPAVSTIADYVSRQLGPDARGAVTPDRLYEVRKVLSDKLGKTQMNDDLGAAAKSARRETMGLIDAIDQSLDAASGNQWSPYLNEYSRRSAPITSGDALRDVAGTMADKPTRGGFPEVTAAGYGRALNQTEGTWGNKLQPDAAQATDDLLAALRRAEDAGRSRKIAGTMGGGSQTSIDTQLASVGDSLWKAVLHKVPVIGEPIEAVSRLNQERMEAELARMMQQPTRLAAALRQLPPSYRVQAIQNMMRSARAPTGAAAGAAINP